MEITKITECTSDVPSGFTKLDELTGGFRKQELVFVGARSSMGKTALALSMVKHMAVERKIPIGYFSPERSYTEIGQSLLAGITCVSQDKLRKGLLSPDQWSALNDAAVLIRDSPFYMVDTPSLTIRDIAVLAHKMVDTNKVKVIFIDSFPPSTTDVLQSLKLLARDLNLPVVLLSRLNQDFESIEQIADTILLLHHEKWHGEEQVLPATITVTKQRNGPTGEVQVTFEPDQMLIANKD